LLVIVHVIVVVVVEIVDDVRIILIVIVVGCGGCVILSVDLSKIVNWGRRGRTIEFDDFDGVVVIRGGRNDRWDCCCVRVDAVV
jgi:hypothetical protein